MRSILYLRTDKERYKMKQEKPLEINEILLKEDLKKYNLKKVDDEGQYHTFSTEQYTYFLKEYGCMGDIYQVKGWGRKQE